VPVDPASSILRLRHQDDGEGRLIAPGGGERAGGQVGEREPRLAVSGHHRAVDADQRRRPGRHQVRLRLHQVGVGEAARAQRLLDRGHRGAGVGVHPLGVGHRVLLALHLPGQVNGDVRNVEHRIAGSLADDDVETLLAARQVEVERERPGQPGLEREAAVERGLEHGRGVVLVERHLLEIDARAIHGGHHRAHAGRRAAAASDDEERSVAARRDPEGALPGRQGAGERRSAGRAVGIHQRGDRAARRLGAAEEGRVVARELVDAGAGPAIDLLPAGLGLRKQRGLRVGPGPRGRCAAPGGSAVGRHAGAARGQRRQRQERPTCAPVHGAHRSRGPRKLQQDARELAPTT
jgi:hypothetical protein